MIQESLTRDELRLALHRRLAECDAVLAMWEAGSAAFARDDEMSDLDIGVLVRGESLEIAWQAVERGLEDAGGFSIRWENPGHIFKGMTQRVYRPTRGGRWLDLDIGIFVESADDLYLQPRRHGSATILFDRSKPKRTTAALFDEEAHARRMREALHQEIMRWNLYRDFVAKEIARGRTIDAFGFYLGFAVRPVITLLGMLHRPDRFDYGFRYVKEDLPAEALRAIERLCYVESPAALLGRVEEADRIFTQTLNALKRVGIQPLDAKASDVLRD